MAFCVIPPLEFNLQRLVKDGGLLELGIWRTTTEEIEIFKSRSGLQVIKR